MTTIRRINVSQIDGNGVNSTDENEIRPLGETAFYLDTDQNPDALTLMMFNGERTHVRSKVLRPGVLYGSGSDSSDGNGYDTIKLIPDSLLDYNSEYTNNQHIIIEPAGANNVHIRSGGNIDQSTTDLVLGGELNHVKVSDTNDTVVISTDSIIGTKTWSFNAEGEIVFPDGSIQTTAYTGGDANIWVQDFTNGFAGAPGSIIPGAGSVEYDADGNIIAVFEVTDISNTSGSATLVAKFDTFGAKQWEVVFEGSQYTDGWGLTVDKINNWGYVAGQSRGGAYNQSLLTKINLVNGNVIWSKLLDYGYASNSPVVDVAGDNAPIIVGYASNGTDNYITVTKLAADGSYVWAKSLNGYGNEEGYGMGVGPSGEVVVVGFEQQFLATNVASALYTAPGSNANWTVNTTIAVGNNFECDVSFTTGVPTFTNIIDRAGNRSVEDLIVTVSGTVLGGTSPEDDMEVRVNSISANSGQANKVLVAKYAANGDLTWQKSIELDSGWDCTGSDADIDSDGNIYICGNFDNPATGNQAMFLFKLDSAGVGQWTRKVIGNCNDSATSIVVGPDDHLYLSAVTANNPTSDFSLVVAKYSRNGTIVWQRLLDNTTTWTFGGNWWFHTGGGSNIAVKDGYIAVAGGFADPGSTTPQAIVSQLDMGGTLFATGNYDFKSASFVGLLSGTPTIVDDFRVDVGIEFGLTDFDPFYDITLGVLVGELHVAAIGGGAAATGDITFDANKIIGAGADSGDGNNYDTIRLVPDISLYGGDQYLIIDPTGPNHIHIRAGGAQDASSADLFLGGEQTHIMVTDTNHTVTIKTWDANTSNFDWRFESDGTTTFPTLTVPINDNANPSGTGQTLKFSDSSQQAIIYGPSATSSFLNAERIIIQGATGYTGTAGEGGDVYLWAGPGGDTNGNGGDIKIRAGYGNGTGAGGYLNFQAGDSSTGDGGYINIESGESNTTGFGGDITINARSGGEITLRTYQTGSNNWLFGVDGSLTLPAGGEIKSATGTGDVIIEANNGILRTWAFKSIGTLNLPDFGSVPGSGDGVVGDICRNGDILYFKTSSGWATIGMTL